MPVLILTALRNFPKLHHPTGARLLRSEHAEGPQFRRTAAL